MNFSEQVLPIVRNVREILLPHWGKAEVIRNKAKRATDVVTEFDVKVEAYLISELIKIDPSIKFVGEEGGGSRKADRFWLIDPIDGTSHFVRGLPFCTTMLALIENGEISFSAIYDFVNDKMYWAEKGRGAFEGKNKISVSSRGVENAYIGCEVNTSNEKNKEILMQIRNKMPTLQTISAGYEYILVATGMIEGRIQYEPYGHDYDFTPGSLLVAEAGGIVRNIGSNSFDYNNLNSIAANPNIYKELTEGENAIFPIE